MTNLSAKTEQALVKSINEASDLYTAFNSVLNSICEITHWDYGEVWIPCEGALLELHPAFYITSRKSHAEVHDLEQFRICTQGFTFPPGVGLPGRVWSMQKAEWLPDASSQSECIFLRHQIAKAFGVKTGFGVPILANQQVLTVLAFFMLDASQEDKCLTELVARMVTQVGNKLENLLREG